MMESERSGSNRSYACRLFGPALLLGMGACAPLAGTPGVGPDSGDFRVYDTAAERWVTFPVVTEAARGADVIFFGEFHDDAVAQRLQLRLLDDLSRTSGNGTLALEMFEREVQPVLDAYARGDIDSAEFRASARPWPNFDQAYHPTVEMALRRGWRVVGTNMPQAHATLVARQGRDALDSLPETERRHSAARIECPRDAYWQRFLEAMDLPAGADGEPHPDVGGMIASVYEAQCTRDETMAETLATVIGAGPVVHINGSFHSDFGLGAVPRLLRRSPEARIRTISAVPILDLTDPPVAAHLERADYVIFTLATDSASAFR